MIRVRKMSRVRALTAFLLLPAAFLFWTATARAQTLNYRTHPDENVSAVAEKLGAQVSLIEELNPGKIGKNGKIVPYTNLKIPTDPEHEGRQIGAELPETPDAKNTPAESAPAPEPNAPTATSPVAAPPSVAAPSAAPPSAAAPAVMTYDTRDGGVTYSADDGPSLGGILLRLVIATPLVGGMIYLAVRTIRRFGWEERLARLAPPGSKPSHGKAGEGGEDGDSSASFAALLHRAKKTPAAAAPAKSTVKRPEEKTLAADTSTRRTAAAYVSDAQPATTEKSRPAKSLPASDESSEGGDVRDVGDTDDIPETSLEDALRHRHHG